MTADTCCADLDRRLSLTGALAGARIDTRAGRDAPDRQLALPTEGCDDLHLIG